MKVEAASLLWLPQQGAGQEDPRQTARHTRGMDAGVRQKGGGVWFKTTPNGIWTCLLECADAVSCAPSAGLRACSCAGDLCATSLECVQVLVQERQTVGSRASGPHTCIHQSLGRGWANRSIITSEEHSLADANPRQERGRDRKKDKDPLQNQLKPN